MRTPRIFVLVAIMLLVSTGTMNTALAESEVVIGERVVTVEDDYGNVHFAFELDGEIVYSNVEMCPNPTPILELVQQGNDNALYRVLQTPNAERVQVSYSPANSHDPYMEVVDGTIHLGWVEDLEEGQHVYYARSINDGLAWFYIDATAHCAPYLEYCELDPADVSLVMEITQTLESMHVLSGCHYLYVPLPPPDDFPYPLPPGSDLWGTVNDPYFDQYLAYEFLEIRGRFYYKPMCVPRGIPNPPRRAPDLTISAVSWSPDPIIEDGAATFQVVVENQGNGAVSGNVTVELWEADYLLGAATLTNVPDGGNQTVNISMDHVVAESTLIAAKVDPYDDVPEGDEENNEWYFNVEFIYKYDLAISAIEVPQFVLPGNDIPATIRLRNDGYMDAIGVHMALFVFGEGSAIFDQLTIPAHGETVIQTSISPISTPGSYQVDAAIDYYHNIPEGLEGNNFKRVPLEVAVLKQNAWVVTGDEEYDNVPFVLKDDLIVTGTGNLTLGNSKLFFQKLGQDDPEIHVMPDGILHLLNSELSGLNCEYGFTVEGYSTMQLSEIKNVKGGIVFEGAVAEMLGCTVSDSTHGIVCNGSELLVSGTYIHHVDVAVSALNSANLELSHSTIIQNSVGIYSEASNPYVEYSHLDNQIDFTLRGGSTADVLETVRAWNTLDTDASSILDVRRKMFLRLLTPAGQPNTADVTLTINQGQYQDGDDGTVDGCFGNLSVMQYTVDQSGQTLVPLDVQGVPLDNDLYAGYEVDTNVSVHYDPPIPNVEKVLDWDAKTAFSVASASVALEFLFDGTVLYDEIPMVFPDSVATETYDISTSAYGPSGGILFSSSTQKADVEGEAVLSGPSYPATCHSMSLTVTGGSGTIVLADVYGLGMTASPREISTVALGYLSVFEHYEPGRYQGVTGITRPSPIYNQNNRLTGWEIGYTNPSDEIVGQVLFHSRKVGIPYVERSYSSSLHYTNYVHFIEGDYPLPEYLCPSNETLDQHNPEGDTTAEMGRFLWQYVYIESSQLIDSDVEVVVGNGGGIDEVPRIGVPHVDNWGEWQWIKWKKIPLTDAWIMRPIYGRHCWAASMTAVLHFWGKYCRTDLDDISKYTVSSAGYYDDNMKHRAAECGYSSTLNSRTWSSSTYMNELKNTRPVYFEQKQVNTAGWHCVVGEGYKRYHKSEVGSNVITPVMEVYIEDPREWADGDRTVNVQDFKPTKMITFIIP